MSLVERLTADMKAAMKAREAERLTTVRMLLAELKNLRIELRRDLTEDDEIQFLSTEAKKRRESIDAYVAAGSEERATIERDELVVIEAYLPEQLTPDEVRQILVRLIESTGASSKRDLGRVMGSAMKELRGRFPGKDVKPLLESLLPS
jgi:uncharacterized protein YqeY